MDRTNLAYPSAASSAYERRGACYTQCWLPQCTLDVTELQLAGGLHDKSYSLATRAD